LTPRALPGDSVQDAVLVYMPQYPVKIVEAVLGLQDYLSLGKDAISPGLKSLKPAMPEAISGMTILYILYVER
jgi:hypothetical protein